MTDLLPVFWLCGPSGVGKSTIAWELFDGRPGAGYLDIDQVGMCFPAIPADPGRTLLQGRILGLAVANFRAAGASCLIVSGCVDAAHGIHTEYLADAALQVIRLRCDRPDLRRRLESRDRPGEDPEPAVRGAEELDRSGLPYECLDTTGRTVAEVLAAVRDRWPFLAAQRGEGIPGDAQRGEGVPGDARWGDAQRGEGTPDGDGPGEFRWPGSWPPVPPGEIVWVCGAAATGKSAVGFAVFLSAQRGGRVAGFADLQQLGFLRPAPPGPGDPGNHRLKAANLAAAWRTFHAYGARRLVVVGHVDHPDELRHYTEALAPATFTLYRLQAGPEALRDRIRQRGLGGGPGIAGDELRGRPAAELDRAHEAAVTQAAELDRAGIGDVLVDTDGRTVDDLAAEIVRKAGW